MRAFSKEKEAAVPATTTSVAFLLTFGFTAPGASHFVSVPGIASLEECQYLAKQLIVSADPKFKCTAYKVGRPSATRGQPEPKDVPPKKVTPVPVPVPATRGGEVKLYAQAPPVQMSSTATAPAAIEPYAHARAPEPLQAFIDTVMLPFDFLSYPGGRDW